MKTNPLIKLNCSTENTHIEKEKFNKRSNLPFRVD